MPRAVSSFCALIKCARAIFQISDRSQTLYKTICITSWTECNFIQLYGIMLYGSNTKMIFAVLKF